VDRLWRLIAQRTLLGGHCIGDILATVKNVTTPFLAVKHNGISV